jgi:hypothetical protein
MDWSAYEVFSVISGIVLLAVAFAPRLETGHRFWAVLGGALFIGYGIYVAGQSSGTFVFPAVIFVIPFVGAIYLISEVVRGQRAAERSARPSLSENDGDS